VILCDEPVIYCHLGTWAVMKRHCKYTSQVIILFLCR
jgi:hypothetical protein